MGSFEDDTLSYSITSIPYENDLIVLPEVGTKFDPFEPTNLSNFPPHGQSFNNGQFEGLLPPGSPEGPKSRSQRTWDPTDPATFSRERRRITARGSTSGFFVDDSFPPDNSSLIYSDKPEFEEILDKIVWRRPYEINSRARLVSDKMSPQDIQQQALGDCWFVSACAAIAERPRLMKKVLLCIGQPLSGENYKGLPLTFQFFQNGDWTKVTIDDYLPVIPHSNGRCRLVFSRSTSDEEMWVPLLEKAYAKLKGSYEGLVGGHAANALSDLTGGIAEIIILKDETEEKFWKRLNKILKSSEVGLATASRGKLTDGELSTEDFGLATHHAYTLLDCVELPTATGTVVKLIRVRNPWANDFEFKGPWNDNDPSWNSIERQTLIRIGYQKKADGEFFMEFKDFMMFFMQVTICTLQPDFQLDGITDQNFLKGCTCEWIHGVNAGGCLNYRDTSFPTNPQFLVRPDSNVQYCLISVLQHNPFVPSQKITLPYMGLYVYELTDRQKTKVKNLRKLKVMFFKYTPLYTKTKVLANFQQTVIRCSLNANNYYVIIPCLFKPEDEAKFLLRVYADGPFELDPLTN